MNRSFLSFLFIATASALLISISPALAGNQNLNLTPSTLNQMISVVQKETSQKEVTSPIEKLSKETEYSHTNQGKESTNIFAIVFIVIMGLFTLGLASSLW